MNRLPLDYVPRGNVCAHCKERKPADAYTPHGNWCKLCYKLYNRATAKKRRKRHA